MSGAPAVSIVVPVFNGGALLRETVHSALGQSFGDFELILVDDGSTDHCVDAVRSLDSRIVSLVQDNRGPSAAAQTGLQQARGEFIAFLDQDDLWDPGKLAAQVKTMRSRPTLALTFCATGYVGAGGEPLPLPARVWDGPLGFEQLMRDFVIGNTSSVMVRRSAAIEAGGFDPRFHYMYDLDLFLRIALLGGGELAGTGDRHSYYRRHSGQMSRGWRGMAAEWESLLEKIRALAGPRFKGCEAPARANMSRYFAYLCYETGAPLRGLGFLAAAAGRTPAGFLFDRRNWLVAGACLAAAALPAGWVRRLSAAASGERDSRGKNDLAADERR